MKEIECFCALCEKNTVFNIILSDIKDNDGHIRKNHSIIECLECSHCILYPFPLNVSELEQFYPNTYYAHEKNNLKKF